VAQKIANPDTQSAFELLMQYGAQSPVYTLDPGGHRYIKDFRFKAAGQWPFAFTCTKAHLLFYLRPPGVRALGATPAELRQWFSEVKVLRGGKELNVRIQTPADAENIIRHVLDPWAKTLPRVHGIPAGINREDVLQAIAQIVADNAGAQFGESLSHDVVVDGVLHSPERVLGVAARRTAGRELLPEDLAGDGASNCQRILAELGFEIVRKGDLRAAREATEERLAQTIRQRTDIGPTVKQTLIHARRGQGVYRAHVEQFEQVCRVTGVMDRRHLRASHIKPWRHCSDAEMLDGQNGLLLAPHVEHLFDQGYISFADDGKLLVSQQLNRVVLKRWGIAVPMQVAPFRAEQQLYLAWHRERVFDQAAAGRRKPKQ
jgi:HNH endonuclease